MVTLALLPLQWLALPLMIVLGVGWIIALTTLNGVAQAVLPDWVRGRGLSVYLMVSNGAMAAGSLFWGLMASRTGLVMALLLFQHWGRFCPGFPAHLILQNLRIRSQG